MIAIDELRFASAVAAEELNETMLELSEANEAVRPVTCVSEICISVEVRVDTLPFESTVIMADLVALPNGPAAPPP